MAVSWRGWGHANDRVMVYWVYLVCRIWSVGLGVAILRAYVEGLWTKGSRSSGLQGLGLIGFRV